MKYVDEYRNVCCGARHGPPRCEVDPRATYHIMERPAAATLHAISRYGLDDILPGNVQVGIGPGCPV